MPLASQVELLLSKVNPFPTAWAALWVVLIDVLGSRRGWGGIRVWEEMVVAGVAINLVVLKVCQATLQGLVALWLS